MIDLAQFLSISIALFSFCGVIWRVAAVEKDIQLSIKYIESKFDIFQSSYKEKQEHQEYLINDLYGQIKHKSQRLMNEIKDLEADFKEFKKLK